MLVESKLIFIISQPRAGSTLTQKLLSNNVLVDTVSEPWLLLPLLSIYRPDIINARYNYPLALAGVFDYLEKKGVKTEFRDGLKKFILSLYKVSTSNHYFIDKTPRYYEILPEIIDLFPSARFIVLKRNPMASLFSMISTWSDGKVNYSSLKGYRRDFLIAPFLIQKFCDEHASSQNVMIIKYEDLVSSPESEVGKVYDWLGIPFSKEVLNIGGNDKVKGIYGDDIFKKEPLNMVTSERRDLWRIAVDRDKDLSVLFGEYQDYLSENFIREYGYERFEFAVNKFTIKKSIFQKILTGPTLWERAFSRISLFLKRIT